jgi:hypothetical protein
MELRILRWINLRETVINIVSVRAVAVRTAGCNMCTYAAVKAVLLSLNWMILMSCVCCQCYDRIGTM